MFYYTYLIYVNDPKSSFYGCVYYGQHHTDNLLDGYVCSGKLLSHKWLKKHPNGYYRKILHLYNSDEELNKAEYELIHPHLGKSYCLNLIEGGHFGRLHPDIYKATGKKISNTKKEKFVSGELVPWNKGISYSPIYSKESRENMGWNKGGKAWNSGLKNCFSKEWCIQQSERYKGEKNPFFGHTHSEEQRKKWSIERKGSPPTSGSTGYKWINNGKENKYINPKYLDEYFKLGYIYFGKLTFKHKNINNK